MQVSPIKSVIKWARLDAYRYSFLSDRQTTIGNSLTLTDTDDRELLYLKINGETVGKKAVFGTDTVRIDGVASLAFTAGATLTFAGFAATANNTVVTLSSINGFLMTFPTSTFTATTELQGTITDGTSTVDITVSPDNPQILTSQTSFDYMLNAENLARVASSKTFPYTNSGITYNYDDESIITVDGTTTTNTIREIWSIFDGNFAKIKKGQSYTLSIKKVDGSATGYLNFRIKEIGIQSGTSTERTATLTSSGTEEHTTITPSEDVLLNRAFLINQEGAGIEFSDLKVMVGIFVGDNVGTDFKLNRGVTANILNQDTESNQLENRGIPVTYNPDGSVATWAAQDKIVKVDGVWKLRHYTWEETLPSNATLWSIEPLTTTMRIAFTTTETYVAFVGNEEHKGLSNYLPQKDTWSSDYEHFYINGYRIYVFINKDRLASLDEAGIRAFLEDNPLTFIGILKSPKDTELCAADQPELNSVEKTFAGITNISLSDIGTVELDQWSRAALA
jgi:hypothetical protein